MCCAIVALLLALFPAWPGGREAVLRWFARARFAAVGAAAGIVLVAGSALAAEHVMRPRTAASDMPWLFRICGALHDTTLPKEPR